MQYVDIHHYIGNLLSRDGCKMTTSNVILLLF